MLQRADGVASSSWPAQADHQRLSIDAISRVVDAGPSPGMTIKGVRKQRSCRPDPGYEGLDLSAQLHRLIGEFGRCIEHLRGSSTGLAGRLIDTVNIGCDVLHAGGGLLNVPGDLGR